MSGTILAQGQPRMRGTNLHVLLAVGDALSDLVIHPTRGEIGECPGEWDFPTDGHASCDPHHVGLGDADLEKTIREGALEGIHLQ